MFNKTNGAFDLAGLDDFIEKPSYDCNEDELENGVKKILNLLGEKPSAIMNIIASHPFIPASFLLDDLAEKMNKRNNKEQLVLLFDACSNDLIEACLWNLHDLERCIKSIPTYRDRIIKKVLSNENWIKRIFDGDKEPAKTLKEIEEKYPDYNDEFIESYNQFYNDANFLSKKY
ncbi:MAG: hypothetical protein H0W64_11350 [Gammaproteobacteria bacterium]|nr:hypothetical protein [Gammaproteobacteria bacterium]